VRERHADADADVVLVLDSRVDLGADTAGWPRSDTASRFRPGGSLDAAVRAATSLAATFLRQGDRVGLVDLGRPQLSVPIAGGRRQLLRLRGQLVTCVRLAGSVPRPVLRPERLPPGAVVIVLSPFADDAVLAPTVQAVRRGCRVLAMDVLPRPLLPPHDQRWGAAAVRILLAERDIRLAALRAHGVPVVPVANASDVLSALRAVSRPRRAGR
jgi:uncharacterized protein (DUF58 family)